jgi:hypothetical protein
VIPCSGLERGFLTPTAREFSSNFAVRSSVLSANHAPPKKATKPLILLGFYAFAKFAKTDQKKLKYAHPNARFSTRSKPDDNQRQFDPIVSEHGAFCATWRVVVHLFGGVEESELSVPQTRIVLERSLDGNYF